MVDLPVLLQDVRQKTKEVVAEKLRGLFPNGCHRVLLIEPPQVPEEDYDVKVAADNRYPVYPPYGLGVLSRDLRRRGYETDILELNFGLQEDLLKKWKESEGDLQKLRAAFNYRIWEEWTLQKIREFSPDLIGTTCMFTITHRQMVRIADFVKAHYPSIPVVAGGVHTSMTAPTILKEYPSIDFIVLYEGNDSFGDVLDSINGRKESELLTQLATLINGEVVLIDERVKKTPASYNISPYYHDLNIGEYSPKHGRIGTYYWLWPEGTRASTVLSNTGCRAQCTFCSVREFNGVGVFIRDVTDVVDEIQRLKEVYGIIHFMWLDDDLLFNTRRTVALFNEMVKRNLQVTWDASNGIIASVLNEEIAHAAYESGCIGISIGVESGNAALLKSVMKPSTIRHFYRCMDILRKYPRIFTKFLLMVGFPDETIAMVNETVKLAVECGPDWSTIQPLNFIPGVELTNHALSTGILTEKEVLDGTERPFVGSTGGQIRREEVEKERAIEFINLLEVDQNYVPTRDQIKDVWMIMDWKINYEGRIWLESNPIKLEMLRKLFVNICDKTHHTNALGNFYFAVIEAKLGRWEEARKRLGLAKKFAEEVAYWRVRFQVLGLNEIMAKVEKDIEARQIS